MDVSFISVLKLTENLKQFLKDGAEGIILIKPQFEGARALVEKHGIVKKPSVHIDILNGVVTALYDSGYSVEGLTYSGIKGAKGNIEFLLYIKHNMLLKKQLDTFEVKRVVEEAHTELSV
jgi:23S rRNA (cytidine1920-2'-O)/16S rRNA (cytidine1409-2'-O)-methyltransferase